MSLEELAQKYVTDKRGLEHNYVPFYEKYFESLRNKKLKILEIGIYRPNPNNNDGRQVGASLKTWYEYFPNAEIYGVDLTDFSDIENDRIKTLIGNQGHRGPGGLENIITSFGSDFDIIIDDGGHTMQQQLVTLGYMFKHLKPGGIFVIEDLHTSKFAPHAYNPTNAKTALKVLEDYVVDKKIVSEFITNEESDYLNKNILSCEINMAKISEICFIIKK